MKDYPAIRGLSKRMTQAVVELDRYKDWVPRTHNMNTVWALYDRGLLRWEEPDHVQLTAPGHSMAAMLKNYLLAYYGDPTNVVDIRPLRHNRSK